MTDKPITPEIVTRRLQRLEELITAVTQGREAVSREFTMRVPADHERDADLILSWAKETIESQAAQIKRMERAHVDVVFDGPPRVNE